MAVFRPWFTLRFPHFDQESTGVSKPSTDRTVHRRSDLLPKSSEWGRATGQDPTRGTHCPGPSNSLALDLNFPTNESSVAAFTRSVNSRFTASISGI